MGSAEDRYVFHVQWFDDRADLIRTYLLTYYTRDDTIEMYDMKNRRPFLKRCEYAEVRLKDLYIGAILTVLARQLKIVAYADPYTENALGKIKGRTLALIKPDAYTAIGKIISTIYSAGFVIARLKMLKMTPQQSDEFCQMLPQDEATPEHAASLHQDVLVAMELVGDDAANRWLNLIGPSSPDQARRSSPRSLRALFGQDDIRNAVHGSAGPEAAAQQLGFFFAKRWPTTALFNNCTLCIVRPHAVVSVGGEIVNRILEEGFEISALLLLPMEKATAQEFIDVYKGVLPEYHDMVDQLCSGPCLVMEVRQENAVDAFRKLVGPHDPEVAKHLRPDTLRAKFGIDRVRNAMHCTDLPEDGLLEVEYFFNILYNRDNP